MNSGAVLEATDRTQLTRRAHRAHYDLDTINSILDEGFVCHLGFTWNNHPFVIPTCYGRDGRRLLVHGSAGSRMLRALSDGIDACLTVTLVDGIILARGAFNQSINYRSVVVLGKARPIEDLEQKSQALIALSEHLVPKRWDFVREPSKKELAATLILEMNLDEASAKIRSGPPLDEDEDYDLPIWAGELPVFTRFGTAVPDPRNLPEVVVPEHAQNYHRTPQVDLS